MVEEKERKMATLEKELTSKSEELKDAEKLLVKSKSEIVENKESNLILKDQINEVVNKVKGLEAQNNFLAEIIKSGYVTLRMTVLKPT